MTWDVIVLGAGGVGSAAAWRLARRGARVVALERFGRAHDRGSSHGRTRIIRQAYFEHPDYVPLLRRGYEIWSELEQARGQRLFHRTGLIEIGRPDGALIPGVLEAARRHGLEVDELSPAEARRRFPAFRFSDGSRVVLERQAGYLRVEDCVLAQLAEAERAGAEVRFEEPARRWRATGDGVVVETALGRYEAGRLVVCGGAWAGRLLSGLDLGLRVVRKHLHWYATEDRGYAEEAGCPTFFYELPEGYFYGFPRVDDLGVKVAEHSGGEPVADPLTVDRGIDPEERRRVESFLARHLPGVTSRPTSHSVCLYTRSPDEHFLVGRHPEHGQVVFAAGLSGHGFKFAGVLGEVLADLALDGRTPLPIAFLDPSR